MDRAEYIFYKYADLKFREGKKQQDKKTIWLSTLAGRPTLSVEEIEDNPEIIEPYGGLGLPLGIRSADNISERDYNNNRRLNYGSKDFYNNFYDYYSSNNVVKTPIAKNIAQNIAQNNKKNSSALPEYRYTSDDRRTTFLTLPSKTLPSGWTHFTSNGGYADQLDALYNKPQEQKEFQQDNILNNMKMHFAELQKSNPNLKLPDLSFDDKFDNNDKKKRDEYYHNTFGKYLDFREANEALFKDLPVNRPDYTEATKQQNANNAKQARVAAEAQKQKELLSPINWEKEHKNARTSLKSGFKYLEQAVENGRAPDSRDFYDAFKDFNSENEQLPDEKYMEKFLGTFPEYKTYGYDNYVTGIYPNGVQDKPEFINKTTEWQKLYKKEKPKLEDAIDLNQLPDQHPAKPVNGTQPSISGIGAIAIKSGQQQNRKIEAPNIAKGVQPTITTPINPNTNTNTNSINNNSEIGVKASQSKTGPTVVGEKTTLDQNKKDLSNIVTNTSKFDPTKGLDFSKAQQPIIAPISANPVKGTQPNPQQTTTTSNTLLPKFNFNWPSIFGTSGPIGISNTSSTSGPTGVSNTSGTSGPTGISNTSGTSGPTNSNRGPSTINTNDYSIKDPLNQKKSSIFDGPTTESNKKKSSIF